MPPFVLFCIFQSCRNRRHGLIFQISYSFWKGLFFGLLRSLLTRKEIISASEKNILYLLSQAKSLACLPSFLLVARLVCAFTPEHKHGKLPQKAVFIFLELCLHQGVFKDTCKSLNNKILITSDNTRHYKEEKQHIHAQHYVNVHILVYRSSVTVHNPETVLQRMSQFKATNICFVGGFMVWKRTCSRVHVSAALTQKVRNTTSYFNRNFLLPLKEKR